jgi:hypothetical protein
VGNCPFLCFGKGLRYRPGKALRHPKKRPGVSQARVPTHIEVEDGHAAAAAELAQWGWGRPWCSYRTPLGCGERKAAPHKKLSLSLSSCRSRSRPSRHHQGRTGRQSRSVSRRSRRGALKCAPTAPPCAPLAQTRGRSLRERWPRPPLLSCHPGHPPPASTPPPPPFPPGLHCRSVRCCIPWLSMLLKRICTASAQIEFWTLFLVQNSQVRGPFGPFPTSAFWYVRTTSMWLLLLHHPSPASVLHTPCFLHHPSYYEFSTPIAGLRAMDDALPVTPRRQRALKVVALRLNAARNI